MNALPPGEPVDELPVWIEIPRFSFMKRGSSGELDFISPLPCPFNYGSVPDRIGLEGDLLDALVLGPRMAVGTRIVLPVWGAVGLSDRGMYDDKLICGLERPTAAQWHSVAAFFRVYGAGKRLLNLYRGRRGLTRSEGFVDPRVAIARSHPRDARWTGPPVSF